MSKIRFGLFLLLCTTVVCRGSLLAAPPLDYQRDIAPILSEHCHQCHGVDADERKGGLRLDLRDIALKGGESGVAAIIPEHPETSELMKRVLSKDPDSIMPPPSLNKPLSQKQIEALETWIKEGAKYEAHWAFTKPQKKQLPNLTAPNPIDSFVAAHLKEKGLSLSPRATSHMLCRRLYLDVIGLPPSPQQLLEFEKIGLEATLNKLLESENYGEKWARPWLDVARYSDTNGYEKDMPREQWAWRDWVVQSLNQDIPYDRFLIEQVAGDLLPGSSQREMIATGFLRNSMINEEGAIVPEQFRMVEMFDRMDCIGKAVLGLSTQCAQCHSHKFDPITKDEYYGMFAFLNTSYEAQSFVYSPEQMTQIRGIQDKLREIDQRFKATHPQWESELSAWEQSTVQQQPAWEALVSTQLETISGLNHPTQEADLSILMKGHVSNDVFMLSTPSLNGVTGLRIEALTHRDLPFNGPGRNRIGTWGMNELEVFIKKPDSKDWEKQKLINASCDFAQPEQKLPDGKKSSGPVTFLIDGTDDTSWNPDRGIGRRNQPSVAVVQFEQPLNHPEGTQLKITWRMTDAPVTNMSMTSMLGCARFSLTRQPAPAAPAVSHAAVLAMAIPAANRSVEQKAAIYDAWRATLPDAKPFNDEINAVWNTYPTALTSILHMAEQDQPFRRKTFDLNRGNWDQPLETVPVHTPKALHPFRAEYPQNRLGFAQWLVDPESPLTARVAVNRVWQSIFGTGLVETAEDFGTRTTVPEYRELLDWLAVDFMENGWSQKKLIRTIISSAVYQQSSVATEASLQIDPYNVLLARGPRFRVDAEVVRDIALSVSGLLTNRLGGPSVIPPVPQNVLDYNYTYPTYWKAAEGPERYRRTLYGFRKRSMPDPAMSNFDAPNGDVACARRVRSNTPLAALTGLNETIFVEAARALALRILRESKPDDADRAAHAFFLCTLRQPNPDERQAILDLLESSRKRIADGWLNPREITTGDAAKLPELPTHTTPQDAAAWTLAARVLLNLDETITKK